MIKVFSKLHLKLFFILSFLFFKGHSVQNTPTSAPECTTLSSPLNGAIDVPVDANLTWNQVEGATGYHVFIRTTEDENIYALYSTENALTYDPTFNFPEDTQIYVQIFPYSSNGDLVAEGCAEETFRTGGAIFPPNCTNLINPLANTIEVSTSTDIIWNAVEGASGYRITIQDGDGLNETISIENVTTYNLPFNLPDGKEITISIIPFNSAGDAMGCTAESFKTEEKEEKVILLLPKFFTPNNDNVNDFWIVPNQSNDICCVFIYNQYGKLLKSITNLSVGWDGTYQGNLMPSNDYWYVVNYKNGEVVRGHFSLIR